MFRHTVSAVASITSRKRSPYRRWQSAGNHGNFSDKHWLLDPGTRSGNWQGPNNCLHRRSRLLPQSHSTCWVTHHHTDPIARVTSHSISIANRLLTPALPPYHCWSRRSGPIPAGFVSVGQAIFAQAGQAAQARLSSMNTRLCRSLDWLKTARRPHGKPNLIDDLTPSPPMKPAWPKRAKQTRHAQPLALHPVPTSRVHRSDPTVEFIDIPPSICLSPVSSWSLGHPMAAACRGWSDRSLGPFSPKGDFHRQDAGEAGHGRARFYHC